MLSAHLHRQRAATEGRALRRGRIARREKVKLDEADVETIPNHEKDDIVTRM
jgi:hypothetical protein